LSTKDGENATKFMTSLNKQRLINVWHSFEQCVINDARDKWRKRLCVGIRVKAGNLSINLHPYNAYFIMVI